MGPHNLSTSVYSPKKKSSVSRGFHTQIWKWLKLTQSLPVSNLQVSENGLQKGRMVLGLPEPPMFSENPAEILSWMYRTHWGIELYPGETAQTRALLGQSRKIRVKKGNISNTSVKQVLTRRGDLTQKETKIVSYMGKVLKKENFLGMAKGDIGLGKFS